MFARHSELASRSGECGANEKKSSDKTQKVLVHFLNKYFFYAMS